MNPQPFAIAFHVSTGTIAWCHNAEGLGFGGVTELGGLLGAGLGAAVGSASGHAGTGAAIGGGVGALGGLLLSAEKEKKEKEAARYDEQYVSNQTPQAPQAVQQPPSDMKVKKRVIKEYDSEGNVVSEKEVAS